ncbi:MAG: menaquinone biosynthesis protein [Thermodesulfobacteriota bacterium]|nr:menaquinone biosynthesis protein [Thermodesulfobacteriota bacterium]
MDPTTELTLGYIPYLNCVPFFHQLKKNGFKGKLVTGVPSELNRMLQRRELDVSPSSSFEYARNWQNYLLLPNHSISSIGKVKSVLLFSPVDLSELSGRQIAITGESATSINLLRIIFREFYAMHDVTDVVPDLPIEAVIAQNKPALLIGDRALRLAHQLPSGMRMFDLGEIWHQKTGLPFVFALWMINRNALNEFSEQLALLGDQLLASREYLIGKPYPEATKIADNIGLDAVTIVDYWNTIDYSLGKDHLQGVKLFFQLCRKYNLLEEEPELNFWG